MSFPFQPTYFNSRPHIKRTILSGAFYFFSSWRMAHRNAATVSVSCSLSARSKSLYRHSIFFFSILSSPFKIYSTMPFFQKCRTTSDNHPQSAGWSRLWYTPFRQHQIFNSHSLQSESSVFDSNGRWNTLSTRTHYRMTPITIGLTKNMTVSFQLALTTECIPLGKNDYNLSTRTHYGVYQNSNNLKYLAIFLSTRTHYGVYLQMRLPIALPASFQLALTTECICLW